MIVNDEFQEGGKMKLKLDTKKIYLAMAERGITATEIARQGGVSQQAVLGSRGRPEARDECGGAA